MLNDGNISRSRNFALRFSQLRAPIETLSRRHSPSRSFLSLSVYLRRYAAHGERKKMRKRSLRNCRNSLIRERNNKKREERGPGSRTKACRRIPKRAIGTAVSTCDFRFTRDRARAPRHTASCATMGALHGSVEGQYYPVPKSIHNY